MADDNGLWAATKRMFSGSDIQKAEIKFYGLGNNHRITKWDVMLNPNSIRRRVGKQTRTDKDANKESNININPTYRDEHLSMQLIFDIVDAYDAYANPLQTKNIGNKHLVNNIGEDSEGKIAETPENVIVDAHKYPKKFKFGITQTEDDISLENEDVSCLPYLIKAAGAIDEKKNPTVCVEFAWGGLSIIGYITDLSIDYNYFSPKGYPLRAYVDLTIYRMKDKQANKIRWDNGDRSIGDPYKNQFGIDVKDGNGEKGLKNQNLNDTFDKIGDDTNNPCFTIKLNKMGTAIIPDDDLMVTNMSVTLSSGFESSVCTFTLKSKKPKYNETLKKIQLDEKMKKFMELGSEIEVCMGYGDENNCKTVFKGNIYTVNFNLENLNNFELEVQAMDVKAFMMENQHYKIHQEYMEYGALVSNIVSLYSEYCNYSDSQTKIIHSTKLSKITYQRKQSDYDFLVSLAKRIHYLFYVINGVVHFEPYPTLKNSTTSIVITPGDYLIDFSREITLSDQVDVVKVRKNNEENPNEPIEGTSSDDNKASDVSNSLDPKNNNKKEVLIIDPSIKDGNEAKEIAKAEYETRSWNFAKGKFKIRGLPEIVPGKYVEIKNVSDDIDQKYFITEVRHEFSGGSYYTYCKFGASK